MGDRPVTAEAAISGWSLRTLLHPRQKQHNAQRLYTPPSKGGIKRLLNLNVERLLSKSTKVYLYIVLFPTCIISAQRISPEHKPKVQLQLQMLDGSNIIFIFTHPEGKPKQLHDRNGVKELLQNLLPRCVTVRGPSLLLFYSFGLWVCEEVVGATTSIAVGCLMGRGLGRRSRRVDDAGCQNFALWVGAGRWLSEFSESRF